MQVGRSGQIEMNAQTRVRNWVNESRDDLLLPVRALLCSPFIVSGISKALDFPGTVAEVRSLAGIEPASLFALLVILIQLGGALLLVLGGRGAWVGTTLLIGFTIVATFLAHPFWLREGTERVRDFNIFWEHVGLVAGLLLAALTLRTAPRLGNRE